jgi:hypothetical protein
VPISWRGFADRDRATRALRFAQDVPCVRALRLTLLAMVGTTSARRAITPSTKGTTQMGDKYKTARDALLLAVKSKDPDLARRAKRALAILDEREDRDATGDPAPDELDERRALAAQCAGLVRVCPQMLEPGFSLAVFRSIAKQWLAADPQTRGSIELQILQEAASQSLTHEQRAILDRAFDTGEGKTGTRGTSYSLELGV